MSVEIIIYRLCDWTLNCMAKLGSYNVDYAIHYPYNQTYFPTEHTGV